MRTDTIVTLALSASVISWRIDTVVTDALSANIMPWRIDTVVTKALSATVMQHRSQHDENYCHVTNTKYHHIFSQGHVGKQPHAVDNR